MNTLFGVSRVVYPQVKLEYIVWCF